MPIDLGEPPRGRGAVATPLRACLLAVAVLCVPYLGFLGTHHLWQPYEPDLVETAREMRASGDWVVPRLNDQIYAEKPPLYYWCALSAAEARGRLDETAGRLPSAISTLLLVAVTVFFGSRLFGPNAGLLAGLIFGTTPLAFQCGTAGMCDMPLALATTGALLAIWLAVGEQEPRGWALVVAGALVGVSMLAKSLIGPVLVVICSAPALALDRERRLPRWPWFLLAGAAFLLVVSPWYLLIWQRQGTDFLVKALVDQTIGRFLGNEDAKGTIFKYLGTVPADLAPWTIFVPVGFLYARRTRRDDPDRWRRLRFLFVGAGVTIAFLSLAACRINKYALPIFPLLAMWLGAALDSARDGLERRLAAGAGTALAVGLGVVAAVGPFIVAKVAPFFVTPLVPLAAAGLVLAAGLYAASRAAPPRTIAVALAAVLSCGASLAQRSLYPAIDETRSDKALEDAITTFVGPKTPYACYRLFIRSYIIFYTERTYTLLPDPSHDPSRRSLAADRAELAHWLDAAGTEPAYVLAADYDVEDLEKNPLPGRRCEVVGRNPKGIGHDDYFLLRFSRVVK